MASLGTITQLPKDFFLTAATLAGDGQRNHASAEQPEVDTGDQEAGQSASQATQERQAYVLPVGGCMKR